MEFGTILKVIVENGGPAMTVAVAFIFYMYKQTTKREADMDLIRADNKDLVNQLISDKEKRLLADAQTLALLEKVLDKSGNASSLMKEAFQRLERNQEEMLSEIRQLKAIANK